MRKTTNFNKDWYFILEDNPTFSGQEADENSFRKLNLPHDWSVDYAPQENEKTGGGGGYAKSGIGWYRKHFTMERPAEKEKIYLYFEGIYMDSTVYVNGKEAGGYGYGYTSFYVDVTKLVREGENLVAVRVKNDLVPNSRWYSGSGIYRDVTWCVQMKSTLTISVSAAPQTAFIRNRIRRCCRSALRLSMTAARRKMWGFSIKYMIVTGSLFPPQGLHCILSRVKAATAWYVRLWKHLIYGRMRILICIPGEHRCCGRPGAGFLYLQNSIRTAVFDADRGFY